MLQLAGLVRDAFFYKSYIPGTHERAEHYNKLHHDHKRQLYATLRYTLAFWLSLQKELPKIARKKHLELAHCCSFIALEKVLSQSSPIYHVGSELKTALSQLKVQWALPLYLAWIKKCGSLDGLLQSVAKDEPLCYLTAEYPNLKLSALFGHPPLGIRLHDISAEAEIDPLCIVKKTGTQTLILKKNTDEVKALFAKGKISYQNPSAQKLSLLLDKLLSPQNSSLQILDACAAPGAKTYLFLEKMRAGDLLTCSDLPERLEQLEDNLNRAEHIDSAQIKLLAHDWEQGSLSGQFDLILLDGPCSGSGVTRKHPDALWRLNKQQIDFSQQRLRTISHNVFHCLKPGGFLIYATCSLLHAENDAVIEELVESQKGVIEKIFLDIGSPTKYGWQIWPDEFHDGLYYTVLKKTL